MQNEGNSQALDKDSRRQIDQKPEQTEGGAQHAGGGETQVEVVHDLREERRKDAQGDIQEEEEEQKPAEGFSVISIFHKRNSTSNGILLLREKCHTEVIPKKHQR
jgi:hypothetical protein